MTVGCSNNRARRDDGLDHSTPGRISVARVHISLCRMSQAKSVKLPEGGHRLKPWINSRNDNSTADRNCTRILALRLALWHPLDDASTADTPGSLGPGIRGAETHTKPLNRQHPVRWRRIVHLEITSTSQRPPADRTIAANADNHANYA